MADHGHRFNHMRQTQAGKLEERLPMFSVALPPWFERVYPEEMENLLENAKHLTTPFDIRTYLYMRQFITYQFCLFRRHSAACSVTEKATPGSQEECGECASDAAEAQYESVSAYSCVTDVCPGFHRAALVRLSFLEAGPDVPALCALRGRGKKNRTCLILLIISVIAVISLDTHLAMLIS